MYVPIDCAPAQINWNLSLQNGAEHWLRSDKIIWPKIILEIPAYVLFLDHILFLIYRACYVANT